MCFVTGIGLERARRLPAVEDRHARVHQDDVGLQRLGLFDRFAAVGRRLDAEPGELEVVAIELARVLEVLREEDEGLLAHGRVGALDEQSMNCLLDPCHG